MFSMFVKAQPLPGGKKCSFFGKFDVLCFLETPVLRFALLPYYRRVIPLEILEEGWQPQKKWLAIISESGAMKN